MAQIPAFPNPATGAYGLQQAAEGESQVMSRGGEASPNPPSTFINYPNLNPPFPLRLESDQPPPIPSTGTVPFMNPVETPRQAEAARTQNKLPPTMSVNLREDFVNESEGGHQPLTPNLISQGTGQVMTDARPDDPDKVMAGSNPVGAPGYHPVIDPQQPAVTPPVVATPAPQGNFE
jgi:hypothetical protein